ncbi:MAG: hypothetical protein KJO34_18910, partial [Deltaproteobacteria bacterium]|nr:hypothetical protein [Deltaproteobacteria bacterium]
NFAIMKRTYRTLNGCEMQYNAEVGLFTKPSILILEILNVFLWLKFPPALNLNKNEHFSKVSS